MGRSDERTDVWVIIFPYVNELCRNGSPPSPCSFFISKIKQGKSPSNQTPPGLAVPSWIIVCHLTSPGRSWFRMFLKTSSLASSLSKKPAEVVMSWKVVFKTPTFGVSNSGWSSSYFKSASGSLKSAVGGPNRWDGLPYRGPCEPFNIPLMASGLLTQSDGAGPCRISFDVCFRAVKNVHGYPRKQSWKDTYP